MLNWNAMLAILPAALQGWAGVFIVILVVMALIYALNFLTGRFGRKKVDPNA